jgi:hypothetical protein
MDKHLSKVLFRAAGVGTADWRMAPRSTPATPAGAGASPTRRRRRSGCR